MNLTPNNGINILTGWQVEESDRQLNIFVEYSNVIKGLPDVIEKVAYLKKYSGKPVYTQTLANILRNLPLIMILIAKCCEPNTYEMRDVAPIAFEIRKNLLEGMSQQ